MLALTQDDNEPVKPTMTPYFPLFELETSEPGFSLSRLAPAAQACQKPISVIPSEYSVPPKCPPTKPSEHSSLQKLEQLSRQIRDMETAGRPAQECVSSGCHAMDRHLPHGGYARGSMLELLRSGPGSGVTSMALMIARQAIVEGKYLVVVDPQRQFYPPAMKSLGIPLERVIALQPANHADAIWGLAQVLRCPAVGAVIAEVGTLEDRVARRLQLASEQGGGLGIFLRDARSARAQASWADVQWLVRSAQEHKTHNFEMHQDTRWFHLELARCSGGRTGARLTVGVNGHGQWIDALTTQGARHEHASALHLAAQLAQPARRRRDIAG